MADSVCAVVVTYNRKNLLLECLEALRKQTRPVDAIYLIDNASSDGTPEMLLEQGYILELPPKMLSEPWEIEQDIPNLKDGRPIRVHYVRMHTNTGGAGGFYEGMKRAYEKGYNWFWLMDDDCCPEINCLQQLFSVTEQSDVLIPVLVDSLGRRYGAGYWRGRWVKAPLEGTGTIEVDWFSFAGPLVSSKVVGKVGYPRGDFFIWADDLEYALRVKKAGLKALVVKSATIYHDYGGKPRLVRCLGRTSIRSPEPPWKHYYGARNSFLALQNLNFKERILGYALILYSLIRYSLGDVLYERDWKIRLKYRWLGFVHGILGITGERVKPNDAKDVGRG